MNSNLALLILSAVGFGSWPIITRFAGITGPWVGMLVMTFTTIGLAIVHRVGAGMGPIPAYKAVAWLALGAALNVMGMINYTPLIDRAKISPGLIPASAVLMIVYQSLAGVLLCSDVVTPRLVLGVATGCLTAWLLSPQS